MKKFAKTMRTHRELLLNYFRAKKAYSSGVVEGMNNKAKVTMRKSTDSEHSESQKSRSIMHLANYPSQSSPTVFTDEPKLKAHRKFSGFTLVEMAMVLMIIGLLLGGLIPTLTAQMESQRINETRKQMSELKDTLTGFAVINGRLPCPSDGAASSGDELVTGSGVSLTCTLTKGVLPWATLGVNETDGWGRRFTYRVSQGATSNFADGADGTGASCNIATGVSFQLCSVANLNVLSTSGGSNVATNVPAVVVSHGKNGLGAYPAGGGAAISGAAGDEGENADDDNIFVSKDYSADFDDLVIWLSPNTLINRMVTAGKLP